MVKKTFDITFMCDTEADFETIFEKALELMEKKELKVAYKFNKAGRKQYDISFPVVDDEKSSSNPKLNTAEIAIPPKPKVLGILANFI
jgi:hypothetical protein